MARFPFQSPLKHSWKSFRKLRIPPLLLFLHKGVRPEGIWVKITAAPQRSAPSAAQTAPSQACTEGFLTLPVTGSPRKRDFPNAQSSPFFLRQHPRVRGRSGSGGLELPPWLAGRGTSPSLAQTPSGGWTHLRDRAP